MRKIMIKEKAMPTHLGSARPDSARLAKRAGRQGFSFLELMITIAIAGIMTAVMLVSMNEQRDRKTVEVAAREVAAVIREAQNYALTGKGLTASSGNCSYIFSWTSPAAIDYSIGGCFNPARNYTLKNGVQFSGSTGSVSFSVPFSITSAEAITLNKNSSSYYVCIYASGIVRESSSACEAAPSCGDGTCNGTETCSSCPSDCTCACAPVNGGWSNWGSWSACSGGTQTAYRTCTNPTPSCGGSSCVGLDYQTQSCCTPVNGGWSGWGSWGACSVSCGGGTQTAYRYCTNPAPSCGGANCAGSNSTSQSCNTQLCPTSCGENISTGWKCPGLIEYGPNGWNDAQCREACGAVGAWCWNRDPFWGCFCSFTSRDFSQPAGLSNNGLCY